MIKIFIPQDKRQGKTPTRGFWRSPAGRIYYDYIAVQEYRDQAGPGFFRHVERLKKFYQQEAIFYIDDEARKAYIYTDAAHVVELTTRTQETTQKDKRSLAKYCRKFLRLYGGFTIYDQDGVYILEAWTQ